MDKKPELVFKQKGLWLAWLGRGDSCGAVLNFSADPVASESYWSTNSRAEQRDATRELLQA